LAIVTGASVVVLEQRLAPRRWAPRAFVIILQKRLAARHCASTVVLERLCGLAS
jgi:hypothetical protein